MFKKRKTKVIWVGSYLLSAIAGAKGWNNGETSGSRIDQLARAAKKRRKERGWRKTHLCLNLQDGLDLSAEPAPPGG